MKKLQFKFDGSEDAKKCIEWVNEKNNGREIVFNGIYGNYYANDGDYFYDSHPHYTLLTPSEFLREVTGEANLKKVICVDAKGKNLTEGKEYFVVNESNSCYDLKNDSGELWSYDKNCFRSSPIFQYGQEVEGEWMGQEKKGLYIATVKLITGETRHLIQPPCTTLLDVCTSIRPIPTLKQKIVEVLKDIHAGTDEEIADRIIEMVKGGSHD